MRRDYNWRTKKGKLVREWDGIIFGVEEDDEEAPTEAVVSVSNGVKMKRYAVKGTEGKDHSEAAVEMVNMAITMLGWKKGTDLITACHFFEALKEIRDNTLAQAV